MCSECPVTPADIRHSAWEAVQSIDLHLTRRCTPTVTQTVEVTIMDRIDLVCSTHDIQVPP